MNLTDCAAGCTKCTTAGATNCDGADYCDTGYCYYAASATSAGKCISKASLLIMFLQGEYLKVKYKNIEFLSMIQFCNIFIDAERSM